MSIFPVKDKPEFCVNPQFREDEPGRSRSDWCRQFFKLLGRSNRVFRDLDGQIVHYIGAGETHVLTDARALAPLSEEYLSLYKNVERNNQSFRVFEPLRTPDLYLLWNAHIARNELPRVRAFVPRSFAYIAKDGVQVSYEFGYHPETEIFITSPGPRPAEGTEHLERCFSAIPFATPGDRSNFFAWLLGAALPELSPHPLLVVDGNTPGIGKTSLVDATSAILTGDSSPQRLAAQGAEFMKSLSAVLSRNERIAFIDNVDTGGTVLHNDNLVRQLTSEVKSARVLGVSRVVRSSGVLFCMTANHTRLTQDLAQRSVRVRLFSHVRPSRMDPYCVTYAEEHADEIYAELLGLCLAPISPDFCASYDGRFPRWGTFVEPRIVPLFGPLATHEGELDLDERAHTIFAEVQQQLDPGEFVELSCTDLLQRIDGASWLRPFVTTRGKQTALGRFLIGLSGTSYRCPDGPVITVERRTRGDHSVYRFECHEEEA